MKGFGLAALLILVFALGGTAAFSMETETINSPSGVFNVGWNLFALPGIAVDAYPPSVLSEFDEGDGMGLDGRLTRFDAPAQGVYVWDAWTTIPGSAFGNFLSGDGYWLYIFPGEADYVSYLGLKDNNQTDMWISIPKSGWALIGNPYSYPVDWSNIYVTNGKKTITMEEACRTEGWLQSLAYGFESATQGALMVGLPDDFTATQLRSWHGYWVKSYTDDIAIIIPGEQ